MPADDLEQLRAELRRLWAEVPPGPWAVRDDQAVQHGLVAVQPGGRLVNLGSGFFYGLRVVALAAACRNAVPRLFAEIDRLRSRSGVLVLGDVQPDGRVSWRSGRPPWKDAA